MTDLAERGPLGPKREKRKRGTKAGLDHMARVKMLPCVICNAHPPNDAHHVYHGRFENEKASDFETIPLCKAHHQDGPDAIHRIKTTWGERYGMDYGFLPLVAAMLADGEIDF